MKIGLLRDHSFSAYAKISEKLTFLTPDTHTYDDPLEQRRIQNPVEHLR